MQTQRLFEIIYLLLEKGNMTTADLARRLEVSTRTIRRDVDKLSSAGIPVYMTRGKGGGVQLMPSYVLSKSLLNQEEQDEILLALQALRGTGISGTNSSLSGAPDTFDRLAALFQQEDTMDWLEIDFESWGSTPSTKQNFDICQQGIRYRKLLQFDYFASSTRVGPKNVTHRSVEPYRLLFRTNCWYLQAYCLLRDDWRLFKLSRMNNLKITNKDFQKRQIPQDKTYQEFPLIHVKLRFSSKVAFRVLDEFPVSHTQFDSDGSLIIEDDVYDALWIPGYLLSYGGEVEILEPESWRNKIIEQAQDILSAYE